MAPTSRYPSLDPDRRDALLAAARAEFASRGFDSASINRILEDAAMSKGSFYYHFRDKADLYQTVLQASLQQFLGQVAPSAPVADVDAFWSEVTRLCRVGMEAYERDPLLPGLVRSLADAPPEAIRGLRDLWSGWLVGLVQLGQSLGAVRDDLPLSLIVRVTVSLSEGIDLWMAEEHDGDLATLERDHLVAALTDMYRRLARPLEAS